MLTLDSAQVHLSGGRIEFVLNVNEPFGANMDVTLTVAAFDDDCISLDLEHYFLALAAEVFHVPTPPLYIDVSPVGESGLCSPSLLTVYAVYSKNASRKRLAPRD